VSPAAVEGGIADLLRALGARGIRAWSRGGELRLLVPDGGLDAELRQAVGAAKPDLVAYLEAQVAWRVAGMATQAPTSASGFWPLLVARPAVTAPGSCLSCGAALMPVEKTRCCLCLEAARRTIAATK